MKTPIETRPQARGFALIVTLSLMILLTVVAVGLLTLSTISLRSTSAGEAQARANANARLALMLAIGDLQKHAGDDRRITADGSIYTGAENPNVVGVWRSWSPKQAELPTKAAPNYASPKTDNFLTWLVSSNDPDAKALGSDKWAKSGKLGNPVNLFSIPKTGIDLAGAKVEIMKSTGVSGTLAWAVSQSATKAKINVAGPEDGLLVKNVQIQAQARPSLGLTDKFKDPTEGWNQRASRVISMSQSKLDSSLWSGDVSLQGGAGFTASGFGLLTDVVNGGLKTDLSLGFELSDGDFSKDQWSDRKNPFRSVNAPTFGTLSSYKGERTLFNPLNPSGTITANLGFPPSNVQFEFPVASVPTFATLRSFYRTPYHLYNTADGPTVFERGADHVALTQRTPSTNKDPYSPPGAISKAQKTQTGYRPVLDRILFVVSAYLTPDKSPRLVITPIITLWNPYNTALEIEGAVAYPWIDFPYNIKWEWPGKSPAIHMSGLLGEQFKGVGHGRSVNPYFYAAVTSDGEPGATSPIRFAPGQVRVFAPKVPSTKDFNAAASIRDRTVFLQPVSNPNQLSARGGLAIPMYNSSSRLGFQDKVTSGPVTVTLSPSNGEYPFFISLEDGLRAKGSNPDHNVRGEVIGDVQTAILTRDSSLNLQISRSYSAAELSTEPQPFGVLETYHRTALDSSSGPRADLVFTNNPRQQFMNSYVAQGSFTKSPHYENKLRKIGSFSGLIESFNGSSYYGTSNTSAGQTHLSFFEVPRSPMLSLAGFQHVDLSASSYASANQFGNSWASAYLSRTQTASLKTANGVSNLPAYDHAYLANESLWDSFFFSGAAPVVAPGSSGGTRTVWDKRIATVTRELPSVLKSFVENPGESPLGNPRFHLHRGSLSKTDLIKELESPSGCVKIAGHLMIDGSFNINSTDVDAWAAVLGGLRAKKFDVTGGSSPSSGTSFPRFRDPSGKQNDNWQGFRTLTDPEVKSLAANIVNEVRLRGPFLSLGEFVNRRLEGSALGLKGAVQSAIDATNLNGAALYEPIPPADLAKYPAKTNVEPARTGVGIPGYLTQADLLQSIAPVITPRSDTFTIRSYGEARDRSNNVLAKARCEAVVQRIPDFVDSANSPSTAVSDLNAVNTNFGRRYSIISFRYLSTSEI